MMETIDQRLQALECQFRRERRVNRVLTLTLIAILCIAGAQGTTPSESRHETPRSTHQSDGSERDGGVLPGSDHLRTVEADQFVVLDRHGRSRAALVVTDRGPALSMFDEKGRKRVELSQTTISSGLQLFDSMESAVASLEVPRDVARAGLEIRSSQGSSSMKYSGVSVEDSAEQQRLLLALINGNFPVLGISQNGQNGPSSVEITASDDGSRHLRIHDNEGYSLFSLSAAKNRTSSVRMGHPDHERSLQISAGPQESDGPAIEFFARAKNDGTGGLLSRLKFGLRKDGQPYIRIVDREGSPLFTAPTR